jgi:hypothetical protein
MRVMHSRRLLVATLALALGLTGCASGGGGGGSADGPRRGGSNRIIADELVDIQQLDAYQAIQRLRGQWLRTRGGNPPQVMLDGIRQPGGLESLRSMRIADIEEMRFLSSTDATNRFGTGFDGGAILITTKR